MQFIKVLDDKLEEYFLVTTIMFSVILVFLQVVMRYVFSASLSWSEELARYLFLWQIWVGASFAAKHSRHLKVEMLKNLFPKKGQLVLDVIAALFWIGFCVFLTTKSGIITNTLFQIGQLSPAMRMPMGYAYASVPVGCGLMTFRLLQNLYREIKSYSIKEAK